MRQSNALAIPFPQRFGKWAWEHESDTSRPFDLQPFVSFLQAQQIPLDYTALQQDLQAGLYFDSNIPIGYGLGSSGALCAGIWERFALEQATDFLSLKAILAQMECFFHGKSSGTDPLVSFLNQPVLIEGGSAIKVLQPQAISWPAHLQLFLLDTGISRSATPFIQWYNDQFDQEVSFREMVHPRLSALNNKAIQLLTKQQQSASLFEVFHQISHLQYQHLSRMIPEVFQQMWLEGIESDWFKLKICGAGGGGFILGLTNDQDKTKSYFKVPLLFLERPQTV